MLEKCVLKSYLILLLTDKIPTFSYFLMKISTFSYFFDLSYYLTPCKIDPCQNILGPAYYQEKRYCGRSLVITEVFGIAINNFDAKKYVPYSRVFVETELVVTAIQCTPQ